MAGFHHLVSIENYFKCSRVQGQNPISWHSIKVSVLRKLISYPIDRASLMKLMKFMPTFWEVGFTHLILLGPHLITISFLRKFWYKRFSDFSEKTKRKVVQIYTRKTHSSKTFQIFVQNMKKIVKKKKRVDTILSMGNCILGNGCFGFWVLELFPSKWFSPCLHHKSLPLLVFYTHIESFN